MDIQMKPLGLVKEMVDGVGLEVTYAFDDLVFVQHNPFLVQFTDDPKVQHIFFNVDCSDEDADDIMNALTQTAKNVELQVERKGRYKLTQNEDDTMSLEFL